MDAATLRRLMADRDGGILSDDVIALLDAHVRLDPAARLEAAEYASMAQVARDAMKSDAPIGLPVFPRDVMSAALKASVPRSAVALPYRGRMMGLAAAACVVFAFFAGRLSHLSKPPQGETQVQFAMAEPAPRATNGIWSLDARRRAARTDANQTGGAIKWNSPIEWSVTRRSS